MRRTKKINCDVSMEQHTLMNARMINCADKSGNSLEGLSTSIGNLSTSIGNLSSSMGDISELTTTHKDSLVAAINELVTRVAALEQ